MSSLRFLVAITACIGLFGCLKTSAVPTPQPTDVVGGDFRPGVEQALKRGDKRIVIPPGNYRIDPVKGSGVLWTLDGLKDVEIVADGVTMTGTKLMRAITFKECSGVSLRGLTIDYDPLPFTQGEVIALAADGASIDVRLHAGYPKKAYSRVEILDPKTRFRKKGMPFLWGSKALMIEDGVVQVQLKDLGKFAQVGDLVSFSTGQEAGAPHAVTVESCSHMLFENVTVHSAPGMGIVEVDGEGGSVFRGCRIVPGPKPAGATEERLLSASWDAFQSKTIRQGPTIELCEIRDAGDDSWSVQSSDYLVLGGSGSTLILSSRDANTAGVQIGDRLRTGLDGPEWRIVSRQVLQRSKADLAPEILAKLAAAKSWDTWEVSPVCIVVTLDHPCDLKPGTSVYSPDRMGNGFVFRNNKIHSSGRILLKAGGLVEGNLLDTPHALIVCPEVPYSSAAGIEGLTIRGNVIRNAGWFCPAPWSSQAGQVSFTCSSDSYQLRSKPVFKNVVIEENTIEGGAGPQLVASSVAGLTVRNNRFLRPLQEKSPETGSSYHIPKDMVAWITLCSEVVFESNSVVEPGAFAGKAKILVNQGTPDQRIKHE